MNKVIILTGISGSGKSTWAEEFIKNNPNCYRINRDSIREMLIPNHIETWYKSNDISELENIVTNVVIQTSEQLVYKDKDIIFDNTNLNIDRLNSMIDLYESLNYQVVIKIFDVPLLICRDRVSLRDNINTDYILKQYNTFIKVKDWILKTVPDLVIND